MPEENAGNNVRLSVDGGAKYWIINSWMYFTII